ncbi:MAG: tRNA (guanosine(37)-N1)-methyltransferase TrmD [Lentisphaerae bacterium GWF2_52_8]|nr:MAG: tRNA (guanosine(37)-N1)-methyltransferase TrmD [Lentisphaerae bacterium GWF2_52_8]
MFRGPFDESIVARARTQGLVQINLVDLRDFTHDAHRTVDDKPYGGGPGMLMKPEPLCEAVESLRKEGSKVIFTSPQGEPFTQRIARELAREEHLIIVCGHYEGIDERALELLADREVSIGDYVLTSGNLPAMVMTDAVVRLLPGALGSSQSEIEESFSEALLEYPQYTRPAEFRGLKVPEVLLSGDHGAIAKWRCKKAEERTGLRRPDLLRGQD